jgi:hypothetical protein
VSSHLYAVLSLCASVSIFLSLLMSISFHLSFFQSSCLSSTQFICLSIYLSFCLLVSELAWPKVIYLSIYIFISVDHFVPVSLLSISVYVSFHLSFSQSFCLSATLLFVFLFIRLSVYLPFFLLVSELTWPKVITLSGTYCLFVSIFSFVFTTPNFSCLAILSVLKTFNAKYFFCVFPSFLLRRLWTINLQLKH